MVRKGTDGGFTLVELMVVVLVVGILVAIAIPVFYSSSDRAQQRTCYANQRTIAGGVEVWLAVDLDRERGDLAGIVSGGHALIGENILGQPPRCPAAPEPADIMAVTVATGAYTLGVNANVTGCTHGTPVHGTHN